MGGRGKEKQRGREGEKENVEREKRE